MCGNYVRLLFLMVLIASMAFYGLISSAQPVPSEVSDPPIVTNIGVFLNNEPTGSVSSRLPLVARLRSILKQRERNAVFIPGTYEFENRVLLSPDRRLSMLGVGQLSKAMQDAGAQVMLPGDPKCGADSEVEVKPNPLMLVVSNKKLSVFEMPAVEGTEDCWIPALVTLGSEAKSTRVTRTGFEISSNGSYSLNDRMQDYGANIDARSNTNFGGNRALNDIPVRQKPVEFASLLKEINLWVDRRIVERETDKRNHSENLRKWGIAQTPENNDDSPLELSIIVSEKAAFSTLIPILSELRGPKVLLLILVRTMGSR